MRFVRLFDADIRGFMSTREPPLHALLADIGSLQSGVPNGQEGVDVTCSVTPSGAGFALSANVQSPSGSFLVDGKVPRSGTGTGLMASLAVDGPEGIVAYRGASCTVTLETVGVIGPADRTGTRLGHRHLSDDDGYGRDADV
jgi:hypothetical protein